MNISKPGVVLNCRTCTRACKQYKSLQDEIEIESEGSITLAQMLQYCSNLSFNSQDGDAMPQHICLPCIHLLEQAFNFKRMVVDSDELLRLGLEEDNNANMNNQDYVMIELLGGETETELAYKTDFDEITAIGDGYTDQEEFIVEDGVVDAKEFICTETEAEDTIESLYDFQSVDIEYVTIKNEYDSQMEDEDGLEVMTTPSIIESVSEHMQFQLLDDQMIIMPDEEPIDEEPIDEVIGEVEADTLDIECEEHLLTGDSEDGEEYLEELVENSTPNPVVTGTGGEVLPHVCNVCNKAFRQQCRLNQHMRSHIDEKLYACETCGKKLKHLRNYKEHMLTHTNAKPYQCLVCERFYRTTSSLAAHMRTHAEDKPYKCDQCGRSYAAFDHLRRHKLTHTGERPYACDLCDKAYYDSSSLRQHKISHTGEKAFTCEICGVGLSQKSGYKKHMLVHSGEKPHKCHICGRAFTFTSNLNAHVRLHSGEKPFKCDKCMKAFPTKKRLNSHMRVHNKEAPVTTTSNTVATNTGAITDMDPSHVAVVAAGRRTATNMPDATDQQVSTSKVVVVL